MNIIGSSNYFNRSEALNALTAMKSSFVNSSPRKLRSHDPNKPQVQSIKAVWRHLANRLLDVLITHGGISPQEQGGIDNSIEELTFLLAHEDQDDEDEKCTIRNQCAEIVRIAGPILLASPTTFVKLENLIKTHKHTLETNCAPVRKKVKTSDPANISTDLILDLAQQKLDQADLTEDLEKKWELIEEARQLFQSVNDPSEEQIMRMKVLKLELSVSTFLCVRYLAEDRCEKATKTKNIDRRRELLLQADEYIGSVKGAANFYGFRQAELDQLNQVEEKISNALPTRQEMETVWMRQLIILSNDLQGLTQAFEDADMYVELTRLRKELFALEKKSKVEQKIEDIADKLLPIADTLIENATELKKGDLLVEVEQFLLAKVIKNVENLKSDEISGNISLGSSLHKNPHLVKKRVTFQEELIEEEPHITTRTRAQIAIPDTIFDEEHRSQEALMLEELSLCLARLRAINFQHAPVISCYDKENEYSEGSEDELLNPPEGSAQELSERLEQIKLDIRTNLFHLYDGECADKRIRNRSNNEPIVSTADLIDELYEIGLEMQKLPAFSEEEQKAVAECLDEINVIDEDLVHP